MEASKPKRKRKPKSKSTSRAAKDASTTSTDERPVPSGASASPPVEGEEGTTKTTASTTQDEQQTLVAKVDSKTKELQKQGPLSEAVTEQPEDQLSAHTKGGLESDLPHEGQAHTNTNTDSAAKLDSDSKDKTMSDSSTKFESDSKTAAGAEASSTKGDKLSDEEVKHRPNTDERPLTSTSTTASSHVTEEPTNQIAEPSAPSITTALLTNQIAASLTPSHVTESSNEIAEPSAPSLRTAQSTNQFAASSHVTELSNQITEPSAPALIDLSENAQLVAYTEPNYMVEGAQEERLLYPRLDSMLQEQDCDEELTPFSEEDLSILYPNRQLDTNTLFVENFLQHARQERHPLYDLLTTYLKAKQALTSAQKQLEGLQAQYSTHRELVWKAEQKETIVQGKCADGSKLSHSHCHKFGVYMVEHAVKVSSALKGVREVVHEELCMRSYSSQLARIHVDNFLFKVVSNYPDLSSFPGDAPVTSWVPQCPPSEMNPHTAALRDCISVLFIFERRPPQDKEFSKDCRHWLDLLLSALLRIASLSDHRFILNHLLRCPPGVAKWAVKYLHIPSPLHTLHTLHSQFPNRDALTAQNAFTYEWGVESGLYGNWGGPLVDNFITSLATLLLPIEERDALLSSFDLNTQSAESADFQRQVSQPWTFVEESDEEDTEPDDGSHLLLKETDFISLFEQFEFPELFKHILHGTLGPEADERNVERVTSYNLLRLIAFGTCLIKLLGAAFSTLKQARYKEFIKQVGRTIRQTVQYIADIWVLYKSHRLQCGDTPTSLPSEGSSGDPRYPLNRLQVEFDQFVIRATCWILSAHKLGAWQFLADMPYSSVSMETVWKIFWNIYCKQSRVKGGCHDDEGVVNDRHVREASPNSVQEIQEAMKDERYKDQFVDHLMKTYTSEAVFLLTTLVNIARARPSQETELINTITLEIFEVVDYAKDAYSRTGHTLLDSIAIVHPFVTSTLLKRVESAVGAVGENCILLFKELPLHLWSPTSHDLHVITSWLINSPLTSSESLLARNILSGLNWGTKAEEGSSELVLPWSTHCTVALAIVEAHSYHLSSHPGGRDYTPSMGIVGKYASLHRFTMSTDQSEYIKWAWELALMLKLHPNQVLSQSMRTLNPQGAGRNQSHDNTDSSTHVSMYNLSEPPWVHLEPSSDELTLPDLTSSSERELAELRDAVKNEGVLAYYMAMCITSIGTDTTLFVNTGLPMLRQLITEGYYLPVLRVLANVTPRFFNHRDALLEEEGFIQVIVAVCNADQANASLREKWTYATPTPLVTKKMAALIQTQLQGACGPTGVGGEKVLQFWLHILLACPYWYRDRNILHLLDTLCMATHSQKEWQSTIQSVLLEAYKELNPIQPSKGLLLSVTSSIASMVRQEGGGAPSIYNAIYLTLQSPSECPWLAFHSLCAEQSFEADKGIWKSLLKQLKSDSRVSVDTALKRTFTDLGLQGGFPSTHLCIYRWAEFAVSLDHTHPVLPLVWQRFFMLYLQRPQLDSSMPDRASQGLRFFSTSRATSLRKRMKTSLSSVCKSLKDRLAGLEGGDVPQGETRDVLRAFLPKCLNLFQTFRLWVEEPRLHTGDLYLPGLPPQYDANRLAAVFRADTSSPWMEFVALWEVKGHLNGLVGEWMEVATYQKNLGSQVQTPDSSPDFALTRLQSRLKKTSSPIPPPRFVYINPPVSMVARDILLTRDALLAVVKSDLQCVCEQARSYCTKLSTVTSLDEQYTNGLPNLYANMPRQFHVRVPCHSRFKRNKQCQGPATIVFRIEEMTVQPQWEQDLRVNRAEYNDMMTHLAKQVSPELCQLVMKLENTVSELSKMAVQSPDLYPNVSLQNGIALFYEILGFVSRDTRHYPPSRQVLTACLQVLGQEFVQRDPLQTSNILNQLLSHHGNSDILVPLFQPNLSPDQFIQMYGTAAEMAVKESPSVAFSILTKFNIPTWLETFDPSMDDRSQLLQFISQGLCLSGPTPSEENALLVEMYRRHFVQLTQHKFPDQYYEALRMAASCTDNGSIAIGVWTDLCTLIGSHDTLGGCKLSLKQIQDSLKMLSSNHVQRRMTSGQTIYSLLISGYVPVIGKFVKGLCLGLVDRWAEAVSMETSHHSEALQGCWGSLVELFTPWMVTLNMTNEKTGSALLPPCLEIECEMMRELMTIFVEVVTAANTALKDPQTEDNLMPYMWSYYCDTLSLPHSPSHVTHTYHMTLTNLPWATFTPDLAALESMSKLKLTTTFPKSCFVFLGQVFPLIEWKRIATSYYCHDDGSLSANFHILMLQLLVMLTAEREVMDDQDTGIPETVADAHSYHWETVDAKTYQDIVSWQKLNCDPSTVLHTGSCLFLSLRLLKSAAGFPTNTGPPEHWHNDTWEKRMAYVHLVVDLIGRSTLTGAYLSKSYSDALSHLYQTAVDICVHEYTDYTSSHIIPLMQAILNVFSCCRASNDILEVLMTVTFDILDQMPNAHLLTLPIVTASCQAIHSVCCMVRVIEHSIQYHFKAVPKPHPPSAELPKDPICMYGWKSVIQSLVIPEDLLDEFIQCCLSEYAVLTLHAHLLQCLPLCTSMAEEARIGTKVMGWCTQVKPPAGSLNEAKQFLLWEKTLGLLLRQVRYSGGNFSELAPLVNTLASSMMRYGEDKASEGLLGAIGFGKKSIYSYEFRLISRVMSAFLFSQLPVCHTQSTQMRVVPNAPGYIRDAKSPATATPSPCTATKQAEQALTGLDSLMTNKNYSVFREHVIFSMDFIKDSSHCIMDCNKLLVHLCTQLYSDNRCLDMLKVLEV